MSLASLGRLMACLGAGLLYQTLVAKNFWPLAIEPEPKNYDPPVGLGALQLKKGTCSRSQDKLPHVGQGGSFVWEDGVILCHVSARVDCLTKLGRNSILWFSDQDDPHRLWQTLGRESDQYYILVERPFGRPDGAPYFDDIWKYAKELDWSVLALAQCDLPRLLVDEDVCSAVGWAMLAGGDKTTSPSPVSVWRVTNPLSFGTERKMIRLLSPKVFTNGSAKDLNDLVRFHQLYTSRPSTWP